MSVSPKASFTLFGGSLFSFSFGGGGRRARGKGGLVKRLAGLAVRGYREVTGKGASKDAKASDGQSFDDFRGSRPDLFDDQADDAEDQGEDQGEDRPYRPSMSLTSKPTEGERGAELRRRGHL